jgi:hypothetical protein
MESDYWNPSGAPSTRQPDFEVSRVRAPHRLRDVPKILWFQHQRTTETCQLNASEVAVLIAPDQMDSTESISQPIRW